MAELRAPLPEHLDWLTSRVEELVRPGAFLISSVRKMKRRPYPPLERAPVGGTHLGAQPDVPLDAPWAACALQGRGWLEHPEDGESFLAQLNLEDVPAAIRAQYPRLPSVGLVWVTLDLSNLDSTPWAKAYFDPRAAASIRFAPPRSDALEPCAAHFVVCDTLSSATPALLPEVASDYEGLCADYDAWAWEHYISRRPGTVQLGGWLEPIQGEADEERKTLLMAFERLPYGDSGAVYLHHSEERGFFAFFETH